MRCFLLAFRFLSLHTANGPVVTRVSAFPRPPCFFPSISKTAAGRRASSMLLIIVRALGKKSSFGEELGGWNRLPRARRRVAGLDKAFQDDAESQKEAGRAEAGLHRRTPEQYAAARDRARLLEAERQ